MRTHKEIFTEIYDKNVWGGSGGGSSPENTVEYRKLLQKFLKDKNIKSVIDFGCGDWSFSHMIDWSGIDYLGYDCVESVINNNHIQHRSDNIHFTSNVTMLNEISENGGELIIVKDVLQHWSNESIILFLHQFRTFQYILITNSSNQNDDNEDIQIGHSRGLSAKFYPLKQFNPEVLAVIKTTITSEVSLITNI